MVLEERKQAHTDSSVSVGDTCAPLPWGITCCDAEPGTSSSRRGVERFTGRCVMPRGTTPEGFTASVEGRDVAGA